MKKIIFFILAILSISNLFPQQIPLKQSDGLDGSISSAYGPRDKSDSGYNYDFHGGLDIKAFENDGVYGLANNGVVKSNVEYYFFTLAIKKNMCRNIGRNRVSTYMKRVEEKSVTISSPLKSVRAGGINFLRRCSLDLSSSIL